MAKQKENLAYRYMKKILIRKYRFCSYLFDLFFRSFCPSLRQLEHVSVYLPAYWNVMLTF